MEPTPTPGPATLAPTSPPATAQVAPAFNFPPASIIQWLQSTYAITVNNLTIFSQMQLGPDELVGFIFQDATGQRCAGMVQATAATSQIWTGEPTCAPAGTSVILGSLLFSLTNGGNYVAAYGYVDPALLPNANAVGITFPNGVDGGQILSNFGFIYTQPGINFPATAIITDAGGNMLITATFQ